MIVNPFRVGLAVGLALLLSATGYSWMQTKAGAAPSTTGASTPKQAPKAPTKTTETAKETAKEEEQIPPAGPDDLFPSVVARVNGIAILGRDLERRIQTELAPMGNPKWDSLREDYRAELISQSLGSLIATELIYQKAIVSGMKTTEAEIKSEFDKVAKTFANDAAFNTALAGRGTDRAGMRKELERNLSVGKFVQENVNKKIAVTPEEVSQYYSGHKEEFRHEDMVRTSHILVLVPEGASEQQERALKARAEGLLARAKKGEGFALLAKENSMDGSASEGGDIGYTAKGQLAPEYEDAAFALPVGAISDLVRTKVGYHIIKVTDKKKAGLATLEEVREQLVNFLKNQKVEADLQKIVADLRAKAKVELLIAIPATAPSSENPTPRLRP